MITVSDPTQVGAQDEACSPDTRPLVVTSFPYRLQSPNYSDGDYPANSTCEWLFQADTGDEVSDSRLFTVRCRFDRIAVFIWRW